MTAPILMAAESDPANAVRHRVEIAGEVIGYVLQRRGTWIALGPSDAPLGGYVAPLLHPTQLMALGYLLNCTNALSRLVHIEEMKPC